MKPGRRRLHLVAAAALLGLVLGRGSLLAQEAEVPTLAEFQQLDADVETAPVVIDGAELFRVRGVTSYPATRRADEVAARIVALAEDESIAPESLGIVETPAGTEIHSGKARILSIFEPDAALEGISPSLLATVNLQRIQEGMRSYRSARSRENLTRGLVRSLVALVLFTTALWLFGALSRRLAAGVERRFRARVKSLAIGSFEFVRADRMWTYVRSLLRSLRFLVAVALVYFFFDFALRQFPWTRGIAAELDDWMIGPVRVIGSGLLGFIPNLIFLVVLYIVTNWALKLIRLFFESVQSGEVALEGFDREWAVPTFKLVRMAVVVFAVVVAYPYIPGSQSPAFQGISIFLGLLFSFGSSSSVSNIIAGYTMTYRRLFREGDRVRIGEVVGTVSQVRVQVTHVRTPKNEEVVIPNSTILNSEVTNYSTLAKSDGLVLHTCVGIGYETPWRQVEAMLLLAAERTPGLAADRKPFVLQKGLGDFAVTYEINVHCDDPSRVPFLYSELHRQILDVFNEYGIQIMTPAYEGDPEQPKVVPREQWFTAPASPAPERAEPG